MLGDFISQKGDGTGVKGALVSIDQKSIIIQPFENDAKVLNMLCN